MKDEGWLREAFIAAVADAAGVSVARVRVLEVGPPFDLEAQGARYSTLTVGSCACLKAGLARKSVAQRKVDIDMRALTHEIGALVMEAVQEPGTKPDTGAGVMRMLEEDPECVFEMTVRYNQRSLSGRVWAYSGFQRACRDPCAWHDQGGASQVVALHLTERCLTSSFSMETSLQHQSLQQ
eukprot:2021100-Amphidinium_carterae.2